ncbi:MAG: hypothetical protein AAGD38_11410 [Acidobacteriota bacterium]
MTTIRARGWCRVDLAGGTLDIWPLGLFHRDARTVNVTVALPVMVTMRSGVGQWVVEQAGERIESDDLATLATQPGTALVALVAEACGLEPCHITIDSGSPRGAGLGASSALTVALIAAAECVAGRFAIDHDVEPVAPRWVRLARDLEARMMRLPTGLQDHFPSLHGGVLDIRHQPGGEQVDRLAVDLEALTERMLVVYTGQSHISAKSNWHVVRARLDDEPRLHEPFATIAEVAAALPEALEAGDWARVGALVRREHDHRRQLGPDVSTPTIEHWLTEAERLGAWGGKVCGAGGGGSIVVLCPPGRKASIETALTDLGGTVLHAPPTAARLELDSLPA